jgi:O-acetyl-ADP-ribose deacetylase
VYGYPIKEATEIAVQTADSFLDSSAGKVQQVVFCTFSGADKAVYEEIFKNMYSDDDKH